MYKITPPKYSIVERTRFYKDDKEVNLGDQIEFDGGDYSDGNEVFYYSSNVTQQDVEEVKEIFENMSGDEYCGEEEIEWEWDYPTRVMFGKLTVKEVEHWSD